MLQVCTIDLNATSLPLLNARTIYDEFFNFFFCVCVELLLPKSN